MMTFFIVNKKVIRQCHNGCWEESVMDRIQISHNVVDQNLLEELRNHIMVPWQKYLLLVTGCLAVVFAGINVAFRDYFMAGLLFVLAIVCIVEIYWFSHRRVKQLVKNMKEESGKEDNVYTLNFGQDHLIIRNCDMSTSDKMPYANMKRLVETKNTYTIFGKGHQFVIIRKDALKMKSTQFLDFLKSKETHIKW